MNRYYLDYTPYFFVPGGLRAVQSWQQQNQQGQQFWQQIPASYTTGVKLAYALLEVGPDYPSVSGMVTFEEITDGVMVCADVQGLPSYRPASGEKGPVGPFGFHIHEKGGCEVGDPNRPFEGSGGHWNPTNQPHGNHAGDFPVLTATNSGSAKMCFITDRFSVGDILGRSVMIHESPDDYRSQPAGDAGKRIACGSIRPWNPVH
jgi:Cu-Zn family superoxide dismutase